MPQHDMNIANQLFPATRADLNNAFSALVSNNSGLSAPSSPVAGMHWFDTTNNILKLRNAANDAWIELFDMETGEVLVPITVEAVPIGTIVAWPGVTVPEKWARMHGQTLNRADYPGLYNVLGTRFNTGGETSAQFRLPDARGRGIFGRDDMGGVAANRVTTAVSGVNGTAVGATGGSQAMQQHTHGVNENPHDHSGSSGNISGTFNYENVRAGASSLFLAGGTGWGKVTDPVGGSGTVNVTVAADSTGITIENTGSGGSQNMPPAIIFDWIIYTGAVGAEGDAEGGTVEPTLSGLEAIHFACSDESTVINDTGVVIRVRVPYAFIATTARIYTGAANATGTFEVSATVTVSGVPTAMFSTNPTIDATERTSFTATTPPVLAVTELEEDAEIVVSVEDFAAGTATGLKMMILGYRVLA